MKRLLIAFALVFVFAAFALTVDATATAGKTPEGVVKQPATGLQPLMGPCCISGVYQGVREDTSCTGDKKPSKDKFTMEITQAPKCGGTITAKVTDAKDGHVSHFTGTVSPGTPKGCCTITGKKTSGTDTTTFKGVLCKKLKAKWEGKGDYVSDCRGFWQMHQR